MKNITLLDGAVGTSLWERSGNHNPVWTYNIENPEIVKEQAKDFMRVGAKVVLTNTFGANEPAVKASSSLDVEEVVASGVRLAKEALAEAKAEAGDSRYDDVRICLAFGPMSSMLEPWGDLSYEDCHAAYAKIIAAGMAEGADMIELMTFMDLDMLKIGVEEALKYNVPVFASMSFTEFGRTMMGNSVDDIVTALEPLGVAALGINCSLGPDKALPILKEFAEKSKLPILFKPNAGIPILSDCGCETNPCTPENFAKAFVPAFEYASYVGGCCGTNATYLAAIRKELDAYQK